MIAQKNEWPNPLFSFGTRPYFDLSRLLIKYIEYTFYNAFLFHSATLLIAVFPPELILMFSMLLLVHFVGKKETHFLLVPSPPTVEQSVSLSSSVTPGSVRGEGNKRKTRAESGRCWPVCGRKVQGEWPNGNKKSLRKYQTREGTVIRRSVIFKSLLAKFYFSLISDSWECGSVNHPVIHYWLV